MNYLLTTPHADPVVLRNRRDVVNCLRDDYEDHVPGLAEWARALPLTGGTFPLTDGNVAVRPTLRRAQYAQQ